MNASMTLPIRGRWDAPVPELTPEQAHAVVQFHARTASAFDRVTDLSLMGAYAREKGWTDISSVLLPQTH